MSLYSASFEIIQNVKSKSLKGRKSPKRYSTKYNPYTKKQHKTAPGIVESPIPIEKKFLGNVSDNHPDEVVEEILFRRMEERAQRISYQCQVFWMGFLMISTVITGGVLLAYNILDLKA